jgi:hypothetical protein
MLLTLSCRDMVRMHVQTSKDMVVNSQLEYGLNGAHRLLHASKYLTVRD